MTFTATDPPRFIDEREVNRILNSVAEASRGDFASEKGLLQTKELILAEMPRLARAAQIVSGDSKVADITEQLFQKDALELLLAKCRNRYWLWSLLAELKTATFPVPVLAIARAQARLKKAVGTNHFGFAWVTPADLIVQLKGMPPGFVLKLWDTGLILAGTRDEGNGYPIQLNPILVDD
ncbi:MAG: hypothetical protein AB7W16_06880 [Candidatus Obscuribacterales bacterium]